MPGRIPTHRPAHLPDARRDYERLPSRREDRAFYKSPAWRRLRASFLAEHPLCADCNRAGRLTAAEHVHHQLERKARPELALDWANLEALCQRCHNARRGL